MRLEQGQVALVGAEPGDERILLDADEHVAVEHEADVAEHLLLLDALAPGQVLPDACGKRFIEGQVKLQGQPAPADEPPVVLPLLEALKQSVGTAAKEARSIRMRRRHGASRQRSTKTA